MKRAKSSIPSYQAKIDRQKRADPRAEDQPDFVDLTEAEEFELLRDAGTKVEEFADKAEGKRYAAWLEKNPAPKD